MRDDDDAYLHGVHSPLGWSTVLYSAGGLLLVITVIVGFRLWATADDVEVSAERLGTLIGCAVLTAGVVGALLLGGLAASLRATARTLERGSPPEQGS
jgi:hypothetical protein